MLQDIYFGCRRAFRAPGPSLIIIVILGLGIGASTTMVSILDALMWRPISVDDPEQKVAVTRVTREGGIRAVPLAALDALAGAGLPVDGWCGYNTAIFPTEVGGVAAPASVAFVTGQCFGTFGVSPVLGRWIDHTDAPAGAPGQPVAVISHRYWQRMFSGAPDVAGRTLRIENGTVTVVGVMPEGFTGLQKDLETDLFVPFNSFRTTRNASAFIGQLRPGHTIESVRAEVAARWPTLIETSAPLPPNAAAEPELADVQPLTAGFSVLRWLYARPLMALTGLAVVLLALTCINVGGLLLSRVAARGSEIALMRSLGASSGCIARQLLAECAFFALGGSALGVLLAYPAASAFASLLPVGLLPWTIALTPDLRIAAVVAAASVLPALAIAALPIRVVTRGELNLRSDRTVTRTTGWWANALLVAQLAVTVVLVFACGLLVRSFASLSSADPGYQHERVLSVRLTPNPGAYVDLNQVAYYPALAERAASLPGVQSVGFARYFGTINGQLTEQPVGFVGTLAGEAGGVVEYVSPRFFETAGIPLLRGRDVAWSDLPSTPRVALVSESLARSLAADANVVGKVIRHGTNAATQRLEIVGVVGDVSLGNFRDVDVRIVYLPALQAGEATYATLHMRTDGDPMALVKPATELVQGFGREHVQRAATVYDLFANSLVAEKMGAVVSGVAGLLAVMLSCLGVYALLSHAVRRRSREIGIRIALGASPRDVGGLVTRHALALVCGGLAIGLPAAMAGATVLRSLLYGVTTSDWRTMAASAVLLTSAALVAALKPTVRALGVDPATMLRSE